jgi:hypothetical protein
MKDFTAPRAQAQKIQSFQGMELLCCKSKNINNKKLQFRMVE